MSRLGKRAISLPAGVEVSPHGGHLRVKGPKGHLEVPLPKGFSIAKEERELILNRDEAQVPSKALHGLYRSLLSNAILGVSVGFEKRLTLIGVGYRAAVSGKKLDLQVGYSHPTALDIPEGIEVAIEKGTLISIKGIDKHTVGQFAAAVRAIRPPEPYKGKGIRYETEFVRKKEGKAAKGKA